MGDIITKAFWERKTENISMCNALIYDWVLLLPDAFKFIALDHVPIEPMEAIAIF